DALPIYEGRRHQPLPRERAGAPDGAVGGGQRDALPGALLASAQRARRRSRPGEDPRPAAAPSTVTPAAVAAERGQPLLPCRAAQSADERSVWRDDPRGRSTVPSAQ